MSYYRDSSGILDSLTNIAGKLGAAAGQGAAGVVRKTGDEYLAEKKAEMIPWLIGAGLGVALLVVVISKKKR